MLLTCDTRDTWPTKQIKFLKLPNLILCPQILILFLSEASPTPWPPCVRSPSSHINGSSWIKCSTFSNFFAPYRAIPTISFSSRGSSLFSISLSLSLSLSLSVKPPLLKQTQASPSPSSANGPHWFQSWSISLFRFLSRPSLSLSLSLFSLAVTCRVRFDVGSHGARVWGFWIWVWSSSLAGGLVFPSRPPSLGATFDF